jgi:aminoglycoside 2'-N-acetyltransferase I
MTVLRTVGTGELRADELEAVRRMVVEAFGGRFDEHDWEHCLGGTHVLATEDGVVVAHGAVVARTLVAGGRGLRCGYVEAVATRGDRRGLGLATLVMREIGRVVEAGYELGALSDGTRIPGFYQRLGWETWQGRPGRRGRTSGRCGRPRTTAPCWCCGPRSPGSSTSAARSPATGGRATSGDPMA